MVKTLNSSLLKPDPYIDEGWIGRKMELGPNFDGTDYALYIDGYECGTISSTVTGWVHSFGLSLDDATYTLKSVKTNEKTGKRTWYFIVSIDA